MDDDPSLVPARPAATVMLVRDGLAGLEVFMLRRTAAAVFAAGMYVFPGGRVDAVDAGVEAICRGRTDAEASGILQVPHGGLAYWVAAVRECFEEAGVLLARYGPDDARRDHYISFADPDVAARFETYRAEVHRGSRSLVELCAAEGLELATDAMAYVSHWITPIGSPRRFDARFFVAETPSEQVPLHDDKETVDSLWVRPSDALARYDAGELGMFPPTVASVRFLAQHHHAADAVAAGVSVAGPAPSGPPKVRVDVEGEVREVLLPDHPDYDGAPDYDAPPAPVL
jgi:8-oxo-dGTP pyrophosphatase MutT (NUDIX family)